MENLTNISVIKSLFERHGFSFSKTLGQNFLVNPSVCPKIAEMGNAKKGFGVIEIGTGVGVLTHELALRADKVDAIEIDSRLVPILNETLAEHPVFLEFLSQAMFVIHVIAKPLLLLGCRFGKKMTFFIRTIE